PKLQMRLLPPWSSRSPVLVRTAPLSEKRSPAVQVAVPGLVRLRPSRVLVVPASVMPPWAVVVPAPVIEPPVQVKRPATVRSLGEFSVPPDMVRLGNVSGTPNRKLSVPPLIESVGPILISVMPASKLAVAKRTWVLLLAS